MKTTIELAKQAFKVEFIPKSDIPKLEAFRALCVAERDKELMNAELPAPDVVYTQDLHGYDLEGYFPDTVRLLIAGARAMGRKEKEVELLDVGMEPAWVVGEDGLPYPTNGFGPVGGTLHTATQLAAARLKGERSREAELMARKPTLTPVGEVQHLHELNDEWVKHLPIGTKLYSDPEVNDWMNAQVAAQTLESNALNNVILGLEGQLAAARLQGERSRDAE